MNRFFCTERSGDVFHITSTEDINHIRKVLRLREGEKIEICDYESEFICEIDKLEPEVLCTIVEELDVLRESPLEITLFQGIPKLDKMEWIIQKTTELGVARIVPVSTHRAIAKVKKSSKIDRWQKVAFSAAQQSKRMKIPKVEEPIDIKQLLKQYGEQLDILIVPYEESSERTLKEKLRSLGEVKRIGILIGPEGGLDPADLSLVQTEWTHLVSLGQRILRTETAAIMSVGILQYELGDMGE